MFSVLFKKFSTESFHIIGTLTEILYLVLVSFQLGFNKFKLEDLAEIHWKYSVKTRVNVFLYEIYA